jgi:two-component system chemotaxis sensor kinase CheA
MQEVFDERGARPSVLQVIKIHHDGYPVGITVDMILGEYQTVLKPLGEAYQHQEEFSGATILGDGRVALVFDTNKLVKRLILQPS